MNLSNHTALICGGTGRVGSVIAKELSAAGANVIVQYRQNKSIADQLVSEIITSGGHAAALQADVSRESGVIKLIQSARETFNSIHILVNAVHGQFTPKEIGEMTWEDWQVHLDALRAHFFLCKHITPVMRGQNYGRIIYISGGLSKRFFRGCSAYTTIKAGLNGFCKTLAIEEGPYGITVNIVAPGKVISLDERPSTDNPQAWEQLNRQSLNKSPLGRDANAQDVASAVLYFSSREASCITGQTLFVTGGEIMP